MISLYLNHDSRVRENSEVVMIYPEPVVDQSNSEATLAHVSSSFFDAHFVCWLEKKTAHDIQK